MGKWFILGAFVLAGCGKSVSAKEACEKFTGAGLGSGCQEEKPGGLGAAASQKYAYNLKEPTGKTCGVYSFKDQESYEATVKSFAAMAMLAGPHRYGNPKKLVFVQCNDGMPDAVGKELEKAVNSL